jgi:hypothetical protein
MVRVLDVYKQARSVQLARHYHLGDQVLGRDPSQDNPDHQVARLMQRLQSNGQVHTKPQL